MVRHEPKGCRKTQRLLNDFISGELSVESSQEILQHLEDCQVCQQEQRLKEEIRHSIRQSWAKQPMPPGSQGRIRKSVLPRQMAPPATYLRWAAGFVVAVAALYLVTLFAPNSLAVLAVDHSQQVVQDHLRCPESRSPTKASLPDTLQAEELKALEAALLHVQGEAPLLSAHLCRYGGIDFIHFVFKSPQQHYSIILEERSLLERLDSADSSRQRKVGSIPVRLMERDGTSVACFQSRDYFVYLVLNEEDPQRSYDLAKNLFPAIQNSLETL